VCTHCGGMVSPILFPSTHAISPMLLPHSHYPTYLKLGLAHPSHVRDQHHVALAFALPLICTSKGSPTLPPYTQAYTQARAHLPLPPRARHQACVATTSALLHAWTLTQVRACAPCASARSPLPRAPPASCSCRTGTAPRTREPSRQEPHRCSVRR